MASLKLKIKKVVFKRKIEGATVTGYVGRCITNGTAIQAGMSPWDVFYKAGNMFVQPTGIHENTDY